MFILEFDNKRVLQDVYLKSETGNVTGLLGRKWNRKILLDENTLWGIGSIQQFSSNKWRFSS